MTYFRPTSSCRGWVRIVDTTYDHTGNVVPQPPPYHHSSYNPLPLLKIYFARKNRPVKTQVPLPNSIHIYIYIFDYFRPIFRISATTSSNTRERKTEGERLTTAPKEAKDTHTSLAAVYWQRVQSVCWSYAAVSGRQNHACVYACVSINNTTSLAWVWGIWERACPHILLSLFANLLKQEGERESVCERERDIYYIYIYTDGERLQLKNTWGCQQHVKDVTWLWHHRTQ